MRRGNLLVFYILVMVVAGCGSRMVTVSSGEKIVCSECGKTVRSDIKTIQVEEADVSKYSVKETTQICSQCQAKIEEQERAAEAQAERQRKEEQRKNVTGRWQAPGPFGATITIVLNNNGTGVMTESAFGSSFSLKWWLKNGTLLIRDNTNATINCSINDDGQSFTFRTDDGALIFSR